MIRSVALAILLAAALPAQGPRWIDLELFGTVTATTWQGRPAIAVVNDSKNSALPNILGYFHRFAMWRLALQPVAWAAMDPDTCTWNIGTELCISNTWQSPGSTIQRFRGPFWVEMPLAVPPLPLAYWGSQTTVPIVVQACGTPPCPNWLAPQVLAVLFVLV